MKAVTDPNSLANLPECVPRAPSGYPGGQCVVTIDRQLPISPPALLVPPGTDVFVKVIKTRGNEAVLFSLATTHTTPPDVAGAAVKNLITPLQSLVFVQTSTHLNYEGGEQPADKIDKEEDEISRTLTAVQKVVRQATAARPHLSFELSRVTSQ